MWLPLSSHFFTTTLLISLSFYSVNGVNDDSHSNTSGSYEKTKLRHSRHSRAPYILPPEHYGEELPVKLDDINVRSSSNFTVADNHKPFFTNCSTYRPTVLEEEPADTFVFQVQAFDNDSLDHGGTLTYDFVAADKTLIKFKINQKTGKISTKTMLDRDEPNREKEIYITVKATDNGDPPLGDTCPIKIIVIDKNDNRPTFDKLSYEENVPQDLEPNNEVMRISATDIDDGNNSAIIYSLMDSDTLQDDYFYIHNITGIVYLKKKIDKLPGYKFKLKALAVDQGDIPLSTDVDVIITVVESDKKAPYFTDFPTNAIHLKENFSDSLYNIAMFKAVSNTNENEVVFSLGNSRVVHPFLLYSEKDTAFIRLAEQLDYEKVEKYDITVRIQNKYKLAAVQVLTIMVDDVNDNYPKFTDHVSGSVLENEPVGTFVMQVRAVDLDRTPAFSKVTYQLEDNEDFFYIEPETGIIRTKVKFDREKKDSYNVKVIAKDGAPSSRSTDGQPNIAEKTFSIEIADKNDNHPKFEKSRYEATDVPENSNTNFLVIEVKANDIDSASNIAYSIIEGNIDDAFSILPSAGKILVKGKLDYETITNYTLKVKAFDGIFQDTCEVVIKLSNENDNRPVFIDPVLEATIVEESLPHECLVVLKAYDPDVTDRNAPQKIVFIVEDSVDPPAREFFTINNEGCLSLIKPLDRDKPKGYEAWQVRIFAYDSGGPPSPPAMFQTVEVHIYLDDINDNAPFLNMSSKTVIWRENQDPGNITKLIGGDYDTPINGPPFSFEMAPDADPEIRSKFEIKDSELHALVKFDREIKKEYSVPILITDSGKPPQSKVDYLTVIIGDENDSEMKPGSSEIFVYLLEGAALDVDIGRVYVNDEDDWDSADKRFAWINYNKYFTLNTFTGMITMSPGTPSQSYLLEFEVTEDPSSKLFARHTVTANVSVTIKEIPEEAVDKSGSIRFEGITAEEFVTKNRNGESKADILRSQLALALNNSEENIDVFTILHSPLYSNTPHLDVRFSAHGSPYYYPERINSAIVDHQDEMERALGLRMLMINVNECLTEKLRCKSSCTNELRKSNVWAAVYTNTTSFIGINAYIEPVCECRPSKPQFCLNGGSVGPDGGCVCPDSYDGPNCEHTSIGFAGEGWALYPTFEACSDVHITMYVRAIQKDSLIFYVGPESVRPSAIGVEDFMSLELRRGYPVLLVNYGTGTTKIEHSYKSIVDDDFHKIEIILSTTSIEMIVDDCRLNKCLSLSTPLGTNEYLNVNGPLQIGGTYMDLMQVGLHRSWNHKPFGNGFMGCIKNFTFNEKIYNLGFPSLGRNVDPGCVKSIAESITFRFDWTFLLAIIICLAVLTILLMAVAVHRRKVEDMYKDADDIRENIINYEDEGGGEGDMTAYDLNVLRLHNNYDPITDDKYNMNAILPSTGMDEVPDICGFLDGKKHAVDNDPETLPFDDVRHYAYEGDGNTTGSLSSLASGTDEGDLNFDYLSNFGPRFRKLADMYGEDASDEDSDTYHNTASVSWC